MHYYPWEWNPDKCRERGFIAFYSSSRSAVQEVLNHRRESRADNRIYSALAPLCPATHSPFFLLPSVPRCPAGYPPALNPFLMDFTAISWLPACVLHPRHPLYHTNSLTHTHTLSLSVTRTRLHLHQLILIVSVNQELLMLIQCLVLFSMMTSWLMDGCYLNASQYWEEVRLI